MSEKAQAPLDADNVRQRLEAAFARLRQLMRENTDNRKVQYHGMAQGVLIALHELQLLDADAFDARTAELASEL